MIYAEADRRQSKRTNTSRGVFAVRRQYLYLFGFLLGIANTGFQDALFGAQANGLLFSLANLFGFSALIWASLPAMAALVLQNEQPIERPSGLEIVIVMATVAACFLPMRAAAASATSALAVMALTTSPWRSPLARASIIALSCVAALYWGSALLALSGTMLLDLDVFLAGNLSGLASQGNMLLYASIDPEFAGQGFMVAAGCSSLHGISIALLAFVLVTQFYNLPLSRKVVLLGAAGVAATIAVNIARLSAMGHFPQYFEWLHVGAGASISGFASLLLVILTNLGGNWRAITAHE